MNDLKNTRLSGGLQLPCIERMANSLLVSQGIRAIKSGDKKTVQHLKVWLGDLIGVFSEPFLKVQSLKLRQYILNILDSFWLTTDILNCSTLFTINNRLIYI